MSADDPNPTAAQVAEERAELFELIASLAALASRRGERSTAVMLTAIVTAYL